MPAISETGSDVEDQGTPVFKDAEEFESGATNDEIKREEGGQSQREEEPSSSESGDASVMANGSSETPSGTKTPSTATTSPSVSLVNLPSSSSKNVASLRERFEKKDSGKPQLPGTGSSTVITGAQQSFSSSPKGKVKQLGEKEPPASASKGSLLIRDNSIIPEGTDELVQAQERAATDAILASENSPKPPMSASLGAPSMTEPDATLDNPFADPGNTWAGAGKTSTESTRGGADTTASQAPETAVDGWGEAPATANDVTNGESLEDQLSEAAAARIAIGSKRDSTEWSASAASLAGRAGRRSALLSDKKSRGSIEGLERLRENFEKQKGKSIAVGGRRSLDRNDAQMVASPPLRQEHLIDEVVASSEADQSDEKGPGQDKDNPEDSIDWDFWGRVMSDYQSVARDSPQELSRAIQQGIPSTLRGMMWQLMSGSKDEEMEMIYAFYLKQTSPHEKAIRRDLARTFPEQDYFQEGAGTGQENLFNVVKAYSLYDEECGYCQGMQFIVGPLLLNMPDEEAFSTLVRLMKVYDLRGHFIPNMPSLQLRLYQFNRLLEDMLPLLHMHLVRIGIKSSMYASQWFMTLFSYRFPLELVYRILDSVFAEGVEAVFRFAMALMQKNEDTLLKLNFETCLPYLKENLFDIYQKDERDASGKVMYRTNDFVQDAFAMRIMSYNLDQYAAEFEEQVRAANAHRREVEALRLVNRNLAARVKELEENAAAQSAEHVELVKQVVMANLAKDEMAEELVKYKMMYAEAVLMQDQQQQQGGGGSNSHATTPTGRSSIGSTNLLSPSMSVSSGM